MLRSMFVCCLTATATVVSCVAGLESSERQVSQVERADTWALRSYDDCLNEVFAERPGRVVIDSVKSIVMIRVLGEGPERQVTIWRDYSGEFDAIETRIVGESVYEQLVELYAQSRNGQSSQQLCRSIDTTTARLNQEYVPRLRVLLSELDDMQVHLIPPDLILLDGGRHVIEIVSGSNSLTLDLAISSVESTADSHGLDRVSSWASRVLTLFHGKTQAE